MGRERKAVKDMDVRELTTEFGKGLHSAFSARIVLGEIVFYLFAQFREQWTPTVRHLQNAYPNASDQFGVSITRNSLQAMMANWRSLRDGGLMSPDKRHFVTPEMLGALGLEQGELTRLIQAAEAGTIPVIAIEREAKRAQGGLSENDASKVEKARSNIRTLLNPPTELSHAERVAALIQERNRHLARIEKSQAEIARIARELEALQRAVSSQPVVEEQEDEVVAFVPSGDAAAQPATSA